MIVDRCPYNPGDCVVYRPTRRGLDLDVMSTERLIPGKRYTVQRVDHEQYVVVEGYSHPGGGLYWSEFVRCDPL
jgi:hypothetical protein